MQKTKGACLLAAVTMVLVMWGCTPTRTTNNMAHNLALAILNQSDPQTVKVGAPAYLLLVDALIEDAPRNDTILATGANLYGAYTSLFVEDQNRSKQLALKARQYGERALCSRKDIGCGLFALPFENFEKKLQQFDQSDISVLYAFAVSQLLWVQVNSSDWEILANLPKIEQSLKRVIELDEKFQSGAPHLYLGILNSLRAPSLGGRPETGKQYFEKAIELSNHRNLGAKVEFAKTYARLTYNRPLHDQLLQEVLQSDPRAQGLTLLNVLAKRQARELLDSADEYF